MCHGTLSITIFSAANRICLISKSNTRLKVIKLREKKWEMLARIMYSIHDIFYSKEPREDILTTSWRKQSLYVCFKSWNSFALGVHFAACQNVKFIFWVLSFHVSSEFWRINIHSRLQKTKVYKKSIPNYLRPTYICRSWHTLNFG